MPISKLGLPNLKHIMLIILITMMASLLTMAFFTIAERKLLASMQSRKGPNVTGFWGVLQAFADGLKLLLKEIIIPVSSNWVLFLLAPCLSLAIALVTWVFMPFSDMNYMTNFDYSLLILYAMSSLGVYAIIGAGWTSNSKYAFLGGLSSAAQLMSYEVSMSLLLLPVAACANSFNLVEMVNQQSSVWFVVPLLPVSIMFFISVLAETNRAPFDLPEAEAEIVAGYNVEYAGMTFAMFFLAEYSNMMWLSAVVAMCFFGGWLPPFAFLPSSVFWLLAKTMMVCFAIIWVRANYPSYSYDQLMTLGWKTFLPFAMGYFLFATSVVILL